MNKIDQGLLFLAKQAVEEIYYFIDKNEDIFQEEHPREVFTILLDAINKIDEPSSRAKARNIIYVCNIFSYYLAYSQDIDYKYFHKHCNENYIDKILFCMNSKYGIDLEEIFVKKGLLPSNKILIKPYSNLKGA